MSHFHITEWSDFLRGNAADVDRRAMEQHLSDGCPHCQRLVELLGRVARVLHADLEAAPPPYLTRSVQALSRLEGIEASLARASPSPPGRATASGRPAARGQPLQSETKRQVLYFSDSFLVDIEIDIRRDARTACVTGQILRRNDPTEPLARVPAFLICDREVVAGSFTNRLGEFRLRSHLAEPLHLCLAVDEWECIALTLDGPLEVPA